MLALVNYFAHAIDLLDDPYAVAGAAVPDWLGMTQPRIRCRARHARPWINHHDATVAAIARGVVRHHADDDWFHQTAAFGDLSTALAREVRRVTGDADGMRPGFLGHILVELLLDATLLEERPAALERYYDALASIDALVVANAVSELSAVDASQLASIIERFVELRFLFDYADDRLLVMRLNQVMRRVGLPQLPERLAEMLPAARTLVAARRDELLPPLAVRTWSAAFRPRRLGAYDPPP
jgi:hypothetical protein